MFKAPYMMFLDKTLFHKTGSWNRSRGGSHPEPLELHAIINNMLNLYNIVTYLSYIMIKMPGTIYKNLNKDTFCGYVHLVFC